MAQQVEPKQIEKKLNDIWADLAKTGQMKACLFNLILFNPLSKRTEYVKKIAQKVLEKFPCRILLVNHDTNCKTLKTSVSVIPQDKQNPSTLCDYIEINVGTKDLEKAAFLLLPHLLPDLPVYMFWGEEIDLENPLYKNLKEFCTRMIFDSECIKDLPFFTELLEKVTPNIADLNWGRIEAWKNLFIMNFQPQLYLDDLKKAQTIAIHYNDFSSDYFTKNRRQALYFHAWLADRLNWEFVEVRNNNITYETQDKQKVLFSLVKEEKKSLKPGTLISIKITSVGEKEFELLRSESNENQIVFHASTKTVCEVPNCFWIEKAHEGQSLVKEIYNKGTSKHYLSMLRKLAKLPQEVL